MNTREQKIEALWGEIAGLPTEVQNAVGWLVANIDFVDQVTDGKRIATVEMKRHLRVAEEKKDYILWVLAAYKQSKDQTSL